MNQSIYIPIMLQYLIYVRTYILQRHCSILYTLTFTISVKFIDVLNYNVLYWQIHTVNLPTNVTLFTKFHFPPAKTKITNVILSHKYVSTTTARGSYSHGSQNMPQSSCWRQPIHFPQGPFDTTAARVHEEHRVNYIAMGNNAGSAHITYMNKEVEGKKKYN